MPSKKRITFNDLAFAHAPLSFSPLSTASHRAEKKGMNDRRLSLI